MTSDDRTLTITWTPVERDGQYFVREAFANQPGFTEYGPMAHYMVHRLIDERKAYIDALARAETARILANLGQIKYDDVLLEAGKPWTGANFSKA